MFRRIRLSLLFPVVFVVAGLCVPLARSAQQTQPRVLKSTPQILESKTVVRTVAVRNMPNANLPGIMRHIMGTQNYTQEQQAQLRDKLIRSGHMRPASQFIIPLLQKQFYKAPAVIDRDLQTAIRGKALPRIQPYGFGNPTESFDGLGVSTSGGDGCAPPDTNAAAGDATTNQVVEIVNCAGGAGQGTFAVYSKTGTLLVGPVALGSLWTSGVCNTNGFGDNVVDYDQLANRWVISQFAGSGVPTDECVAVSTSDDATGTYNVYDFSVAPGNFADYPKIAVWPDAYYLTTNEFNGSGSAFLGVNFVALDRAQMLAGAPTAQMVEFGPSAQTALAYSVLPADLDGLNAPPAGAPELFANYVSPALFSGAPYALEIWQLSVNWANPGSSTLTGPTEVDVNAFNDGICGFSRACIPEPSPGEAVDSLGDRLMFRLAYRVTADGVQHLVANHTVGSGTPSNPPAGIRWYELQLPSGSIDPTQITVAQQGTYLPADGNSRWMGSIAMDQSGDIALGYSVSGPSLDPSIAYTGRLAGDPAGQMTQPEATILTGTGVQESTANRWGDYSSMVMDPSDDCTFWYAQEYYQTSGSFAWSTHLASFKFPSCTSGPTGTLSGTVTDAGTGNPIAGASISLNPSGITTTTDSSGNYSVTVPVNTYTVTASDFGYITQNNSETISDGVTTTDNFALTLAPLQTVSGAVTDGTPSGHTYPLYGEIKVTASSGGQVADVWANPQTGAYSVNLPADGSTTYTFNVTAYLNGYNTGTANVGPLNGAGSTTQNFPLTVGASCSAPGYAIVPLGEDFEGGVPPTGWSVTNNVSGSPIVWATNAFWNDQNYTGGSGIAATADSNNAASLFGYEGTYDTALVTPEIQVSSLPANPMVTFVLNYQEYSGNEALDVDVSGDGGNTWTNLAHINTNQGSLYSLPGVSEQVPLTVPGGATQIEVRWRYYNLISGFDWYAQIDNVAIGGCAPISGGLVQGQVTDQNTGTGLVGAGVTDNATPPDSTTTFKNAADTNLPVGYYMLFSQTNAADVITASDGGYSSNSQTLNVAPDSVNLLNLPLGAAMLNGSPGSFNLHVMVNNQVNQTFTINNTGTAAGNFSFLTYDFAPPSIAHVIGGPLQLQQCKFLSPLSLVNRANRDPGCSDSFTRVAPDDAPWTNIANYPTPIMDNSAVQDPGSGKIYSFGGYDGSANTNAAYVFDPNAGTWTQLANMPAALEKPTGAFINGKIYVANGWDSSGNPAASLEVYDPSSNTWTTDPSTNPSPQGGGSVAVVLNNQMYVIGGCNASTCGSTAVVVFNPATDSWSSSAAQYPIQDSWESCGAVNGEIYCAGGSAAAETPNTYVYDPTANTWTQLASIPVAAGGLWGSGYTATSQGLLISGGVTDNFATVTNEGFMYSPASNTWTTLPNSNNTVYRGASACGFYKIGGSTGGFAPVPNSEVLPGNNVCGTSPIPWLTINPMTGSVPMGGSTPVQFTFDGTGQQEFTTSQAFVQMASNTPYPAQQVDLTVTWDPQPIDLVVTASGNLGTVLQGSNVVYTVTVTNQAGTNQGSASQTMLTYNLPAGVTDIVNNGPGTCTTTNGVVSCGFGTLATSGSVTETFVITPANTGTLTSTFTASAREPEVSGANPVASVSTTVLGLADVSVASYVVSPTSVTVGSTATFKFMVKNAGPDTATGVTAVAPLPAGLTFKSASSGCTNNGGVVTCNFGSINSGSSATASITVTANSVGAPNQIVTLATQSVDPKVSNNTSMVTLRVVPAPVQSGSGSGGGGEGLLVLAGLAGLLGALRLRKRRSVQ